MKLQESGEMYLETIHILKQTMPHVRSIDIVSHTGYSKPSVSRAVGLLKNGGFILVDHDGYITLTDSGKEVASSIYEKHTLLSEFFKQLGVPDNIASEDACKIEHVISNETFIALKKHAEEHTLVNNNGN